MHLRTQLWSFLLLISALTALSSITYGQQSTTGHTARLRVVSVHPAERDEGTSLPKAILVRLDGELDAGQLPTEAITVTSDGRAITGKITLEPRSASTLMFSPDAPFPIAQNIRYTLNPAITSTDGRALGELPAFAFRTADITLLHPQSVPLDSSSLEIADLLTLKQNSVAVHAIHKPSSTSEMTTYDAEEHSWNAARYLHSARIGYAEDRHVLADGEGGMIVRSYMMDMHYPHDGQPHLREANRLAPIAKDVYSTMGDRLTCWSPAFAKYKDKATPPHLLWDPKSHTWLPPLAYDQIPKTPRPLVGGLPLDANHVQIIESNSGTEEAPLQLWSCAQNEQGRRQPGKIIGSFATGSRVLHHTYSPEGNSLILIASPAPNSSLLQSLCYHPQTAWQLTDVGKVRIAPFYIDGKAFITSTGAAALYIYANGALQSIATRRPHRASEDQHLPAWRMSPSLLNASGERLIMLHATCMTSAGDLVSMHQHGPEGRTLAVRKAGANSWSREMQVQPLMLSSDKTHFGKMLLHPINETRILCVSELIGTDGTTSIHSFEISIP